ncbi:MAG: helix-turn-helix domain-containing protein [Candidatus Gastranaerophilaceae bacterium]
MKTHFNKNFNSQQKNAERKAFIIYHLMRKNITQKQVAEELGITLPSVNQFISGKYKSKNISNWFLVNLKIEV